MSLCRKNNRPWGCVPISLRPLYCHLPTRKLHKALTVGIFSNTYSRQRRMLSFNATRVCGRHGFKEQVVGHGSDTARGAHRLYSFTSLFSTNHTGSFCTKHCPARWTQTLNLRFRQDLRSMQNLWRCRMRHSLWRSVAKHPMRSQIDESTSCGIWLTLYVEISRLFLTSMS
jgi:hypothetical protein